MKIHFAYWLLASTLTTLPACERSDDERDGDETEESGETGGDSIAPPDEGGAEDTGTTGGLDSTDEGTTGDMTTLAPGDDEGTTGGVTTVTPGDESDSSDDGTPGTYDHDESIDEMIRSP